MTTRYTRAWELFPGKNKFYCGGRILTTKGFCFQVGTSEELNLSFSDNKILFVSLGLITVTFALFIGFDCRLTLIDNYRFGMLIYGDGQICAIFDLKKINFSFDHPIQQIPIICTLLYIFVLAMLFRTSFSDPGVVPRKLV